MRAGRPTKEIEPTPISYLGKKSGYLHLFKIALRKRPARLLDLTTGSGTVALFFRESARVQTMILNDVSEYPHLIASAFFEGMPTTERWIGACINPEPEEGWASRVHASDFRPDTARWIDGFCRLNAGLPLMLVALSCILASGRFQSLNRSYLSKLSPSHVGAMTYELALRLAKRQHIDVDLEHTRWNYLDLPAEADALEGYVVYLDPAWPTQPGERTVDNRRAYGFYASTIMSILRQRFVDVPAEYHVGESEFYGKMAATIERMSKHNTMLVAYQTTPDRIDLIKSKLFPGRGDVQVAESQKNSSSGLMEYLLWVR